MRGRIYTKELKESILNEVKEVENLSLVARKHGISKSTISTWIKDSKEKDKINVKPGRKHLIEEENYLKEEIIKVTQEKNALKKILGEKDLEIIILKELLKKSQTSIKDKIELAKKYIEEGYNAVFVLKVVGLARSTYYYNLSIEGKEKHKALGGKPKGYSLTKKQDKIYDNEIKEYILEAIDSDAMNYGYRKIMHHLRVKYDLIINHKKVYRLCRELGVLKNQRIMKPNVKGTITFNDKDNLN
ncbi:IS3 family transposase [Clostridium sp. MSJ-11]|uniref:IS3 family transposase n=1 Tax=Clostridium mobile TaxID=2841512 RepID=A0ABS6EFV0_9CLOT|nr:IS3 family transposase [Clostridium mobile]MBU5484065.1 IS3 family transposase [Clostridium mobile]